MKHVPQSITRAVGRTVLQAQKNSPALLFAGGVIGAVGATVLACRATLKLQDELDQIEKDLIDVDLLYARNKASHEEVNKAKAWAYTNGIVKITKLYAPSVVVGVISIGCLTQSHRQLTQRNAAVTAAYVALQNFLESYRGRVRETVGTEKEREIYYAATPVELVEDTPNGPKKVFGTAPGQRSPYSGIFDERNLNWNPSSAYNEHFIKIQEQQMTDKLRTQGNLLLNEVYDRLGMPRTYAGSICGWFIGHPNSDDFVEIYILPLHDFHGSLMLDFNVGGVVNNMLSGYGGEGS